MKCNCTRLRENVYPLVPILQSALEKTCVCVWAEKAMGPTTQPGS